MARLPAPAAWATSPSAPARPAAAPPSPRGAGSAPAAAAGREARFRRGARADPPRRGDPWTCGKEPRPPLAGLPSRGDPAAKPRVFPPAAAAGPPPGQAKGRAGGGWGGGVGSGALRRRAAAGGRARTGNGRPRAGGRRAAGSGLARALREAESGRAGPAPLRPWWRLGRTAALYVKRVLVLRSLTVGQKFGELSCGGWYDQPAADLLWVSIYLSCLRLNICMELKAT